MANNSSSLTENQIIADIQAGQFAPIYFLTGEENYYIDLLSDFFEKNIVPEENRDFDQTVVYGIDTSMSEVVMMARRFPMMSERQLVLVKEAQEIAVKEYEQLVDYLKAPMPQTVLVLCYRHTKLDKRTNAYKAIAKTGVVFEHDKLRESAVPTWIGNYVKQHGYTITEKATMMLIEAGGNALNKLANELQKVFSIMPQGSVINDSVLERILGISKDYNVFELQNAIGRRDALRCNRIIRYFGDNPKACPMPVLVASLYSYFIKVMIYHQLDDKSQYSAASALKINPFFVKDYAIAASNYSLPKLAACIGYLFEASRRSQGYHNTTSLPEGEILKELIFKIIH